MSTAGPLTFQNVSLKIGEGVLNEFTDTCSIMEGALTRIDYGFNLFLNKKLI